MTTKATINNVRRGYQQRHAFQHMSDEQIAMELDNRNQSQFVKICRKCPAMVFLPAWTAAAFVALICIAIATN